MSSEEVAELAQAIHSHADALYESWTKGPNAIRRMEDTLAKDTLELLAEPGLGKLEHLVSSFVRRDKAKRQHHTIITSGSGGGGVVGSRVHQQSSPPKSQESSSESSQNITSIPVHVNVNGSGSHVVHKKPLPKSILAVVQRFEQPSSSSPLVPLNNNNITSITQSPSNQDEAANTTSTVVSGSGQRMTIPGVGNVSKNVLWTESSNHHTVTEKNLVRHTHPQQQQQQPVQQHESATRSLSRSISPMNLGSSVVATPNKVRERHIPIERTNEPSNLPGQQTRVMNMSKIETKQNVVMKTNNNRSHRPDDVSTTNIINNNFKTSSSSSTADDIKELEREEERLFQALRTGHIIVPASGSATAHVGSGVNSFEALRERASSPLNSSSRIAFAKERIRQSQEHPLTQQRLELQKRLPSPSSSLAAAIAVQQGKIKFQPPCPLNGTNALVDHDEYGHIHPPPLRENGRQSWVSSMLGRFGNGASVADRVQLFEKYPAHMVTPTIVQNNSSMSSPSSINNSSGFHNVSIVNVSMAPKDGLSSSSSVVHNNKQALSTTPWRGIPIQLDTGGSTVNKKQKQSISKPVYPPVPRFYWPEGKPAPIEFVQEAMAKANDVLSKFPPFLNYLQLSQILPLVGIPLYWKKTLWNFLGLKNEDVLEAKRFLRFYHQLISDCPDDATRFLCIMSAASKKKCQSTLNKRASVNDEFTFTDFHKMHLTMSDFIPMMQDIIDTHPGLGFLRDAPEFHSRYITTVISRIFYKVNRSWTGRITLSELRRSNMLRIIKRLEDETDINLITEYFSYEHFYVIYCKFWELDKDHDLLIDKKDLNAHGDYALSSRIIDRIFDGTVIRGWDVASPVKCTPGKMTYSDFVWFLLSEEDKKTPTAIEFWFRCLDVDGDGILSPYELQFFYQEQESRIESYGIEPLDFSNIYCQMVDMLRCSTTGIRLKDLKKNPQLAATVFNTIFNLDKYLDHEQRDPFATAATNCSLESQEGESDWDRYAAREYESLIAEESSPSDHNMLSDFEDSGVLVYEEP